MASNNLPEPVYVRFYKLQKPFDFGGEMVTQLNWVEPIAKHHIDVEAYEGGNVAKMAYWMSLLTNEPMGKIKMLSHVDFIECQKILADFLVSGQQDS